MNEYLVTRYITEKSKIVANSREEAIKELDDNGSYGITTTVTKVTVKKLNEEKNARPKKGEIKP